MVFLFTCCGLFRKHQKIIVITVSVLLLLGQIILYPVKISCKMNGVGSFKKADLKSLCVAVNYPKLKLCQKITMFINWT